MKFNPAIASTARRTLTSRSAADVIGARSPARAVVRMAPVPMALLSLALLSGCSMLGIQRDAVADYRGQAARTAPLEVPPDLSQLARDNRFQPQGSVVSASQQSQQSQQQRVGGVALQPVLTQSLGDLRVERAGTQRWLVVPTPPEQLWPELRSFWEQNGFTLTTDNAVAGVMETNWSENRAKLPGDVVRNALATALGRVFDTGERDQYRTRVERSATGGSEVHIAHRGVEEVDANKERDSTLWRPRPSDPSLEAEFLARLMVRLGGSVAPPAQATAALQTARGTIAAAPEAPSRARLVADQPAATLELDDDFNRAWRRVGMALDRGGFSIEDRDRAGGLYYIRYIDPAKSGQDEPNFFQRLFSRDSGPAGPVRYRVALKTDAGKTRLSVQTSTGEPEKGEDAQRIATQLLTELR